MAELECESLFLLAEDTIVNTLDCGEFVKISDGFFIGLESGKRCTPHYVASKHATEVE